MNLFKYRLCFRDKKLLLLFFFICVALNVSLADQGCAATNTGTPPVYITKSAIYTDEYTTAYNDALTYNTSQQSSTSCSKYYKRIISFGAKGSCTFYSFPTTHTPGYLVNFELNCSIDSNISLMLLIFGALGFILIRRRSLLSI